MKKNMVYFVLYIVLLTELLIVITERDELQTVENEIRNKMLTTLAESYKSDIYLTIPERTSEVSTGSNEPKKIVMTPVGLTTEKEKHNIKYFVQLSKDSKSIPLNWPEGGVSLTDSTKNFKIERQNGNGIFYANFSRSGVYKFTAYCTINRVLPDYLPENLMTELRDMIGDDLTKKSRNESFKIESKKLGGLEKKKADIIF